MDIQNFFYTNGIESVEVDPGVTRKVLAHSENLMICELHFKKGAKGNLHKHPHEQISYVKSGKFEFDIGGKKQIVTEGDSTYKQPNVVHGAVCLEDGVLIDIFTPERKDFLK